jgi:hypothetical protein
MVVVVLGSGREKASPCRLQATEDMAMWDWATGADAYSEDTACLLHRARAAAAEEPGCNTAASAAAGAEEMDSEVAEAAP